MYRMEYYSAVKEQKKVLFKRKKSCHLQQR